MVYTYVGEVINGGATVGGDDDDDVDVLLLDILVSEFAVAHAEIGTPSLPEFSHGGAGIGIVDGMSTMSSKRWRPSGLTLWDWDKCSCRLSNPRHSSWHKGHRTLLACPEGSNELPVLTGALVCSKVVTDLP